mgnify:CR=1 FL=1
MLKFSENKLIVLKFLFAFFLLLLFRESSADSSIWASGSFGYGNHYYLAFNSKLYGGFQIDRFVGQIYVSRTRENLLTFIADGGIEKNYDYGLLGGVSIFKNKLIHLFCTSGFSCIRLLKNGETDFTEIEEISFEKLEYRNILNIPFEFCFSFIKLNCFGVGFTLHVNLNKEFQDFTANWTLYVGKLKRERRKMAD